MLSYSLQTNYQLTIFLNDVNDNGPYFVDVPYDFRAPEDSVSGALIGTVSVSICVLYCVIGEMSFRYIAFI